MPVAIALCGKYLITHCTAERFFPTVYAKVPVNVAGLGGTFTTFRTFIGFLSGMDTKMILQFAVCGKTLST